MEGGLTAVAAERMLSLPQNSCRYKIKELQRLPGEKYGS